MPGDYSKKERHDMHEALAHGFRKHCVKDGGMIINTKKRTGAKIASELERRAAAEDAVGAARAALQAALDDRDRIEKETQEYYDAVRAMVFVAFGKSPEILVDFGLEPAKPPRQLTTEEKKAAVEKARATRAARHVMGRRQRLKIRAEPAPVEAPVVVPLTIVAAAQLPP